MKKIIVFDLDGTLAKSKTAIDEEMAIVFKALLKVVKVAIISGGDWPQFHKQVISNLAEDSNFGNLYILPTCGTKFYEYKKEWKEMYADNFTKEESKKIINAIHKAVAASGLTFDKLWGEQIEDRGSQITFSALGQKAPLEPKEKWDPDFKKRQLIKSFLDNLIPDFSVRLGGTTSIDITKPGIDKAYGIKKIKELLKIDIKEMIFIGDALFPGGNDYPAKKAGVASVRVQNPDDTKRLIEVIIACLSDEKLPTFAKNETAEGDRK
jgi:HAD superfamily hydrolase (TIGR01484 family)